jgi:hypothetical protein
VTEGEKTFKKNLSQRRKKSWTKKSTMHIHMFNLINIYSLYALNAMACAPIIWHVASILYYTLYFLKLNFTVIIVLLIRIHVFLSYIQKKYVYRICKLFCDAPYREKPWKETNGFYIKISFKQVRLKKTEGGRSEGGITEILMKLYFLHVRQVYLLALMNTILQGHNGFFGGLFILFYIGCYAPLQTDRLIPL